MPTSSRFAVAVHILTYLARDRKRAHRSEEIAGSISTNPSVVRRILGDLARAGLTTSQLGKGGGALLARGPKKISLLEIFNAVEDQSLVAMHRTPPSRSCDIGRTIQPVLQSITKTAEDAFFAELETYSLKDVVRSVQTAAAA